MFEGPCTGIKGNSANQWKVLLLLCLLSSASSTSRRRQTKAVPTFAPSHTASQFVADTTKVSFTPFGSPPPTATSFPTQGFHLINHFVKNQTTPTTNSLAPTVSAVPTVHHKHSTTASNKPSVNLLTSTSSPSTSALRTLPPSTAQPLKSCVREWSRLMQEILSTTSNNRSKLLKICARTELKITSSILIHNITNLVIQCGLDGSQSNICVVTGGTEHFRISGASKGIVFKGITFQASSLNSISVSSSSATTFQDCLWMVRSSP